MTERFRTNRQRKKKDQQPTGLLVAGGFGLLTGINSTAMAGNRNHFTPPAAIGPELLGLVGIVCLLIAIILFVLTVYYRRKSHAALRISEQRYRNLVEANSDWIWETDHRGVYTYVSPQVKAILGYEPDDLIGKTPFDIMPPEEAERVRCQFEKYVEQKESFQHLKNIAYHIDGHEILLETNGIPILDKKGNLSGYRGIDRNIEVRHRIERQLKESQAKLSSIIQSSPMGILTYELMPDGRLVLTGTNQAAEEILGIDVLPLTGLTIEEAFPGLAESELPQRYRSICQEGGNFHGNNYEYQDAHIDGFYEFDAFQTSPGKMAVLFSDVAERMETQRSLELTQFAMDHLSEAAFWMDSEANFFYVNKAACAALNYSKEELLTMSVPDIDPDFPASVWPEHWKQMRLEKTARFESHHRTRQGRVFPVEITANFITYDDTEYICAFARDMTEQKQAESALLESQRSTSILLGNLPGTAYRCPNEPDWPMDFISEGCLPMTGYSSEDFINHRVEWNDLIVPEDQSIVWEKIQQAVANRESYQLQYRIHCRDGSEKWLWERGCGVFDDKGNIRFLEGFIADETERIHAIEALRESEAKHRLLFTAANDAIFIMDELCFLDCNPQAASLYGCNTIDELLQKSPVDFSPEYQEDGRLSAEKAKEVIDLVAGGKPQRFPWVHCKLNGELFYAEVSLNRLELHGRTFIQAVVRDVTERRVAEKAREKLLKELRAKNEELESIVYIASHDLRSPLVNIRGFAGELEKSLSQLRELLESESLSESGRKELEQLFEIDFPESLQFINSGNRKMDTLLNGLLKLSRIGATRLTVKTLDMNRLFKGIVNSLRYKILQGEAKVTVDSALPGCCGDQVLIQQVFENLIDNAIKYHHPEQTPTVHISAETSDETVTYCVADSGIGIAANHIDKVFDVFHRLHPGTDQNGEGLGLTIVRRILERQDGHIWIESEVGTGTKVFVRLPRSPESS